jgi:hypothetical protein
MATYSIKLVNHTRASARLQTAIATNLQEFFTKAFESVADSAKVEWGTGVPTDAVVIHVVDDIASSYLQQQMGGADIRGDAGGHTRNRGHLTGSEIYLHTVIGGKRSMMQDRAYGRLAFHEALHNQWPGWSNHDLHAKGSLAASPPQEPLTAAVAELMRRGLSMKNAQLL